jgi:Ca2+/Na+ antiporter
MKLYKVLAGLFYLGVPNVIGFFAFYQGQEPKVAWSFSGIFLLLFVFIVAYNRFKAWHKEQRQAHETARNLGQVSHTVNFTLMGIVDFFFTSVPFIVLILLDGVLKSYDGNLTIWIGYILLSLFVAHLFNIIYYVTEQKSIKQAILDKQQASNQALVEQIREKL